MTYTVSDTIRSAKQIADLENSDFISWNENIRLVNEAFTSIHQKLINKGDMTFVNGMYITKEQYLPEDFYQVLSVLDNYNTPVPRYSIGMNDSQIWYKIINNKLILNGLHSAKLTYFTKPQFLTYTAETITDALPLQEGEEVKFACGNYVLTNNNVWDVKNAVIVKEAAETDIYVDAYGRTYLANEKPIFYPDGRCFKLTQNECTDNNCKVSYSSDIENITFDGVFYYVRYSNGVINVFEQNSSNHIDTLEGFSSNIYFNNNHKFYIKDNIVFVDDISMYDASIYNNQVYMLKIDLNTGYGIFTNNNKILSIAVDTELELPNNLYYNVLAYMLAFSYCCKQGKDPTLVNAQLNNNIEILYDTLGNDAFSQLKITNIYRGMR
jgi:hypothetical protein